MVDSSIQLKKICASCGTELSLYASYCSKCGVDINQEYLRNISTCFHCGDVVSKVLTCDICLNCYCEVHINPVVHECKLNIESHKFQHDYNVALHPEMVKINKPNYVVRGSNDGSYTWSRPELNGQKKKYFFKSNFFSFLNGYEGTLFLLFLIIFFSFVSLDWWNRQYISLSSFGLFLGYYWIFLTSLFVVTLNTVEGIFFFVIDLIFMFMIITRLEKKTSVKLVYSAFGFSGFFSGVMFLLIRSSFAFLIPIDFLDVFFFSVGLGGAGF